MMRGFWAAMVCVVLLTGCQTTSGQLAGSDIHPITGAITIGNSSIQGAEYTTKNRITIREGHLSGYAETVVKSILDADFEAEAKTFRMEIVDADIDFVNLKGVDPKSSEAVKTLVGTVFRMAFNAETGNISIDVKGGPVGDTGTQSVDLSGNDKEKKKLQHFLRLLVDNYLGGKTVRQGQEVMKFDLGRIFGGPLEKTVISGRVIGQAMYNERPVVVIKAIGELVEKDKRLDIDSVYYVDAFTGISVFGTMGFSGLKEAGKDMEIQTTQMINLSHGMNKVRTRSSDVFEAAAHSGNARQIFGKWEGVSDNMSGAFTTSTNKDRGTLTVHTGNPALACSGQWIWAKGKYGSSTPPQGTWSIACDNRVTASGTYTSYEPGKGVIEGQDNKSRDLRMYFD